MKFLRLVADLFAAEARVRSQVISLVYKMALGQFFSGYLSFFSPTVTISPMLHTRSYSVIKKSLCTWWLKHTSFLPHYLAQSDCLAADRQGQGDTRLTLTPSVILNSNYVIMVSDWNCLKCFCVFLYFNHQVHRLFDHPVYTTPYT
jgi:hypothetical protein